VKKRDHIRAWVNHAALNAGAAIQCVWHIALPPQVDHLPHDVQLLATSGPLREFLYGCGARKRPQTGL